MEQKVRMEGLNHIFIWFSNLAYLNFLWVVFSLGGLLILGIAPSTSALFAVIRKLLLDEEKVPILKTFISYYKKDFWKINGLFYLLVFIGLIFLVDIYFLYQVNNTVSTIFLFLLLILSIFYLVICIFIFPVYVHYDLKLLGYFKQSFLFGMMKPVYVLMVVVSLVIAYFVLVYLKTLFFFFGASLGAFIVMSYSHHLIKTMKQTATMSN